MRFLACALVVVFLIAVSVEARGDAITSNDDSEESNSWTTSLSFGPPSSIYDVIESFIVVDTGAGGFEGTGMATTHSGWTASSPNSSYAFMSGPDTSNIGWTYLFAGDMAAVLVIDFLAWDGGVGGTLAFATRFSYSNGSFSQHAWAYDGPYDFLAHPSGFGSSYDRTGAVPEPTTLAFFGLGAGALALRRRRRKLT